MDVIRDLGLLRGSITKKLDIRKIKELSRDLIEGDIDKLNWKYNLEDKEFKKEWWKIYIKLKERDGFVSMFGKKVKEIFR